MKRSVSSSLFVLLVVTLLAANIAGCSRPTASPQGSKGKVGAPYKIGFMAAITGKASSLGEPERDAAVMLQKQLDESGGVIGPDGVIHPIKILIYDSEGSGDVSIPIAKKLITDEKVVALIGDSTSPVSMALVPVLQEAETPLISMASSSAIVEPVAERKWVFKTAQSNKHTEPTQVRYAKAKGYLKVANFYVNDAYGEDGAMAIRDTCKAEGIEIVLEETFGAADTDMTAQLTKLKASGAQALLVTAIPPAASILTKQFREMGLTIPLIHNHGIGNQSFIDLSGGQNADGVLFPMGKMVAVSSLADNDPQKKVLEDFIRDFEASAGKKPSTFAGHAWDALQLTIAALAKLPDGLPIEKQRAQLRDEMEKVQGLAGTGGVFNLSAQDHVGLSPDDIVLVLIQDGKWQYLPPDKW